MLINIVSNYLAVIVYLCSSLNYNYPLYLKYQFSKKRSTSLKFPYPSTSLIRFNAILI